MSERPNTTWLVGLSTGEKRVVWKEDGAPWADLYEIRRDVENGEWIESDYGLVRTSAIVEIARATSVDEALQAFGLAKAW